MKIITREEAVKNVYNLSPSRYVSFLEEITYRPIPQILSELKTVQKEEKQMGKELDQILKKFEPQFDIRQYNCLFWEEGKIDDFIKKLQHRIENTVGKGPLKGV